MQLRNRVAARSAFTIIELLVVIMIIVLLMGLLLPAVQRVMITMEDAKVHGEISQLAQCAQAFFNKHGDYPPSRIFLSEEGLYPNYGNLATLQGQLETYSVDTLRRLFPGIDLALADPNAFLANGVYDQPAGAGVEWHDWNGNGIRDTGLAGTFLLEGEECLVFFLGGIPAIDSAGVINGGGFCTDMVRPTILTPGRNRNGPYFEFKSERLSTAINPTGRLPLPNRFALYLDTYGTPYLYFRARYGTENNYPCNATTIPAPLPGTNVSDCASLLVANGSPNFNPYCKAYPRTVAGVNYYSFHQTDKFMIISAGRDRFYGSGGLYLPQDPDQLQNPRDKDNLANFGTTKLGG